MEMMKEILGLPVDERLSIVQQIWDSINPTDIPIPESHKKELNRRLERVEHGETVFFTWEEIQKELAAMRSR